MAALKNGGLPVDRFLINRRELTQAFGGSTSLVQQFLVSGWIVPVIPGGRGAEAYFDIAESREAYARYRSGDRPLPYRSKAAAARAQAGDRK